MNRGDMPVVCATASAYNGEVGQILGKIRMLLTEFGRIAVIKLFRLIKFCMAERRSVGP